MSEKQLRWCSTPLFALFAISFGTFKLIVVFLDVFGLILHYNVLPPPLDLIIVADFYWVLFHRKCKTNKSDQAKVGIRKPYCYFRYAGAHK